MSHPVPSRCLAALGVVTVALATGGVIGQTAAPPATTPPPATPPPATTPPATTPPATAPATAARDLAPAAAVLEKALDAFGGRKAIDEIKTLRYKLVAQIAGGPATFELRNGRNARFLANGQSTGGTIIMGRHGDVAWRQMPDGYVLWAPDRVGPDVLGYLFVLVDPQTKARTVDRAFFAETDCWKLEITDPDGEAAFAYFEVDGGRLLGLDKVRRMRDEERITRTTFRNYGDVPPLHLFTGAKMIQVSGAALADFEFSEISFNDVPESDFEIPAEVVALAEAEKTKKAGPASRPETKDGETAEANPQMQRLLDRLTDMNDVGQLEMIAGFLEMQLAKEEDAADRASMKIVIEKIRERAADLKAAEADGVPKKSDDDGAVDGGG